jgi:hypothetical protein
MKLILNRNLQLYRNNNTYTNHPNYSLVDTGTVPVHCQLIGWSAAWPAWLAVGCPCHLLDRQLGGSGERFQKVPRYHVVTGLLYLPAHTLSPDFTSSGDTRAYSHDEHSKLFGG